MDTLSTNFPFHSVLQPFESPPFSPTNNVRQPQVFLEFGGDSDSENSRDQIPFSN